MSAVVNQHIHTFDFCDSIEYKGLTIKPFVVADFRICQIATYCLSIDPYEFEDLKLLPLKRLDLILTIVQRMKNGKLPPRADLVDKYELVKYSFTCLCNHLFPDYTIYLGDLQNPGRSKALSLLHDEDNRCVVLSLTEFEDLSELILHQNAIDTSYQDVPIGLRKEIQKRIKANPQEFCLEKLIDIIAYKFADITYEKVKQMPVRKFFNQIDNIRNEQQYEILSHPMYKPERLKHWMFGDYDRNSYGNYIQREDEAFKEINQI